MERTGQFIKRRYGRALVFVSPVIIVCIVTGMTLSILDSRLTKEQSDTIAEVVIATLLIAMSVVIFWRKPLPGLLGRWQKLWQSIPTWHQRLRENTDKSQN